ncbi:hypothetical protein GGU10DRAFT_371179 [Lentinula aff. detonsa]|uniref:Uncharacterized protein n=1 Tax=Lentinula aff. detonsa TaxID=2804958 RepID=A0AA38NSX4_9AGAR|nr:hypothetical protein GGU10DRAFT_371179 [Lentinula aff. detonsa]
MASLFPPGHGPFLPEFSSLLVQGPYPIDCLVNLALSFPDRSVIILSSCDKENNGNNSLRASLRELKLTGKISAQADQVRFFYPPTAAHLALLLSTLQVIDTEKPNSVGVHDTSTSSISFPHLLKPPGPALVIIHEPSAYFINATQRPPSPSSSYLSLLIRAISLVSRSSASLAVFDTHVNDLEMPVHPNSISHHMQAIAPLLANYIELIVHFDSSGLSNMQRSPRD